MGGPLPSKGTRPGAAVQTMCGRTSPHARPWVWPAGPQVPTHGMRYRTKVPVIVFHTHRSQLLTLAGLSGLMGVSGLRARSEDLGRVRKVWNLMGCSYFFFHSLRLARLALRPSAVVLGREGILDQVGNPPAGFVPWDLMRKAEVVPIPLGPLIRKFVGIQLEGPEPHTLGRFRSPLEPPLLLDHGVLIPEYVLEDRVEEIVETMNLYIEDPDERGELGSLAGAPGKAVW